MVSISRIVSILDTGCMNCRISTVIGTNKGIYSHVKRFICSAVLNYGKKSCIFTIVCCSMMPVYMYDYLPSHRSMCLGGMWVEGFFLFNIFDT